MSQQHYGDNFIPVIPTDDIVHTLEQPFCYDPACPCHENDTEAIGQVAQWYMEGLISERDATDITMGRRPLADFRRRDANK